MVRCLVKLNCDIAYNKMNGIGSLDAHGWLAIAAAVVIEGFIL